VVVEYQKKILVGGGVGAIFDLPADPVGKLQCITLFFMYLY
jgi:hypothetical protein